MTEQRPVVFLEGKKTILRPYCEETDLKPFTKWFNDEETRSYLGSFMFPMTEMLEREQMKKHSVRANRALDTDVFLVIERKDEPGPIGTLGIHAINWINRTAGTGSCIGIPELRGQGLGTDAKMSLLRFAFETLNLHVLRSAVIAFNERSAKALLKQGYVQVGRLPEWHYRDGKYHDELTFVLTKDAFDDAWQRYQHAS